MCVLPVGRRRGVDRQSSPGAWFRWRTPVRANKIRKKATDISTLAAPQRPQARQPSGANACSRARAGELTEPLRARWKCCSSVGRSSPLGSAGLQMEQASHIERSETQRVNYGTCDHACATTHVRPRMCDHACATTHVRSSLAGVGLLVLAAPIRRPTGYSAYCSPIARVTAELRESRAKTCRTKPPKR